MQAPLLSHNRSTLFHGCQNVRVQSTLSLRRPHAVATSAPSGSSRCNAHDVGFTPASDVSNHARVLLRLGVDHKSQGICNLHRALITVRKQSARPRAQTVKVRAGSGVFLVSGSLSTPRSTVPAFCRRQLQAKLHPQTHLHQAGR